MKAALTAALMILFGLLLYAFGQQSLRAWQDDERADQIRIFDTAANHFVAGLFDVLLERLHTNNALHGAEPAAPAIIEKINARRGQANDNYQPGLAALRNQQFPNRDTLLAQLDQALAKADEFRAAADQALVLPRDRRDDALLQDFVPVITQSVTASLELWLAALHASAAADPTLAYLAVIKETGWRLRELAGLERSNIAAAIAAAAPLSAARKAENAAYRAQVDILWSHLERLAAGPGNRPAIRAAITAARPLYFDDFRTLADEMARAGDAGGSRYPIDADRWVELSSPQIDALLGVLHAASRESEAHTSVIDRETHTTLVSALSMLAVGCLIAAGTLTIALYLVTLLMRRAEIQTRLAQKAERATVEAEQASRAKSLFLANMSHELRTPLNAIMGFSELIDRHLREQNAPAACLGYSKDVQSASQVLLDLINDVLDIARVETNSLRIQEDIVDVGAALEWAVRVATAASPSSGLTLTTAIEPGLPPLVGDERRIKQILINLLSNALKFTPAPGCVHVTAGLAGDSITIAVADTGIGMTPQEVAIAQQPFQQVDRRLARKYSGAGLGLPLVRALAALHGATLDIQSAPGEGTRVRVTFPTARTRRPAAAPLIRVA